MARFGYIFGVDYATTSNFNELIELGCYPIYQERDEDEESRPQWRKLLSEIKPGDEIYLIKFSNATRNTTQLSCFIQLCFVNGIRVVSIQDQLDTADTLYHATALDVLRILANMPLETTLLKVNQQSTPVTTQVISTQPAIEERYKKIIEMYSEGYRITDIMNEVGFTSKMSVYNVLRKYNIPTKRIKRAESNIKEKLCSRTGQTSGSRHRSEKVQQKHMQIFGMFDKGITIEAIASKSGYTKRYITGLLLSAGKIKKQRERKSKLKPSNINE